MLVAGGNVDRRLLGARQVIEFDQHDGAVNPKIETLAPADRAHPRKPDLIQAIDDLVHPDLGVFGLHIVDVFPDQAQQELALAFIEIEGSYADVVEQAPRIWAVVGALIRNCQVVPALG